MTTYRAIAGTETDPEAPITSSLMKAFQDNVLAGLEGDPTAPLIAAGWHPYNKLINNDANTGRIWSTAVDGAVTLITTPDFVDGWDYGFLFDRVGSTPAFGNLQVNLFRETGAAYAGPSDTGVSITGSAIATGFFELTNARLARVAHFCTGVLRTGVTGDGTTLNLSAVGGGATHGVAQKITRLRFSIAGGNPFQGTGAAIYMLRRRNVAV